MTNSLLLTGNTEKPVGVFYMEGRCMKCKMNREMKNAKEVTMKNGMKAMKGVCTHCGTSMFRIMGKAK